MVDRGVESPIKRPYTRSTVSIAVAQIESRLGACRQVTGSVAALQFSSARLSGGCPQEKPQGPGSW